MTFLLQSTVFPPENQISPVADQLRQMLATAPWARVGLGLPVVGSLVFLVTFFWSFYPWYKKWLEPFVWYFTDLLFDCELARYLPPAQQAPQPLKVSCQDMKLILVSVISNCIAQFKEISSFSLCQSSIQISISLLSGKCEVLSRDLQRVEHW